MAHAKGEYVWFIDSDDYIEANILSDIYGYLQAHELDGVRINRMDVPEDSHPSERHCRFLIQPEMSPIWRPATAVDFIISSGFLKKNKILFDTSISYGEDTLWVFWVNFFPGKIHYLTNIVYRYRQRSGSAMHIYDDARNLKHLKSMQVMLKAYNRALSEYGDELSIEMSTHLRYRAYWSVQNILFDALYLRSAEREMIVNELINDGNYPYPVLWDRIELKDGIKNFIVNLIALPFPFRWYYRAIGGFYSLYRKLC